MRYFITRCSIFLKERGKKALTTPEKWVAKINFQKKSKALAHLKFSLPFLQKSFRFGSWYIYPLKIQGAKKNGLGGFKTGRKTGIRKRVRSLILNVYEKITGKRTGINKRGIILSKLKRSEDQKLKFLFSNLAKK